MVINKPLNTAFALFSVFIFLFLFSFLVTAITIEEKAELLTLDRAEKLELEESVISDLKQGEPLITKTILKDDVELKNTYAKIQFLNKQEINLSRVAINNKLIAVSDEENTQARITLYTDIPNTIIGIYKYKEITSDRNEVLTKGELYTLVKTNDKGEASFRNVGFSTLTYSLADPIFTGVDSGRIQVFDLDDYVSDYDTIFVTLYNDTGTINLLDVSFNVAWKGGIWTSNSYITDDWGAYLWTNTAGTGFELELRTRTINTSFKQNISFQLHAGNLSVDPLPSLLQDEIDWRIGDATETEDPAGSPTIVDSFDGTYYLLANESDTQYFADMEVYFANWTGTSVYITDYVESVGVQLDNITTGSSDSDVYLTDQIQFLTQDFSNVTDLEINNQAGTFAEIGDLYEVTITAFNPSGQTQQTFNIELVGEEPEEDLEGTDAHGVTISTGSGAGTYLSGVRFMSKCGDITITGASFIATNPSTWAYITDASYSVLVSAPVVDLNASFSYQITNATNYFLMGGIDANGSRTGKYVNPVADMPINSSCISWTGGRTTDNLFLVTLLSEVESISYELEATPTITAPVYYNALDTHYIVEGTDGMQFTLDNFFANYTNASITFEDDIQSQTGFIQTKKGGSTAVYYYDHIEMELNPTPTKIYYEIFGQNWDFSTLVNISVWNTEGNVSAIINLTTTNTTSDGNPPNQTATIPNFNVSVYGTTIINVSEYFTNWNYTKILTTNPTNLTPISIAQGQGNSTNEYFILTSLPDGTFSFYNVGATEFKKVETKVVTENGYGTANQTFNITYNGNPAPTGSLFTIFTYLNNMFPDEDELTLSQQMLYIILTMMITAIILGIGVFYTTDQLIQKIFMFAIGLLLIMEVFFFVANGYIPVIVLVLISLGASLILYAIVRKTTS